MKFRILFISMLLFGSSIFTEQLERRPLVRPEAPVRLTLDYFKNNGTTTIIIIFPSNIIVEYENKKYPLTLTITKSQGNDDLSVRINLKRTGFLSFLFGDKVLIAKATRSGTISDVIEELETQIDETMVSDRNKVTFESYSSDLYENINFYLKMRGIDLKKSFLSSAPVTPASWWRNKKLYRLAAIGALGALGAGTIGTYYYLKDR